MNVDFQKQHGMELELLNERLSNCSESFKKRILELETHKISDRYGNIVHTLPYYFLNGTCFNKKEKIIVQLMDRYDCILFSNETKGRNFFNG